MGSFEVSNVLSDEQHYGTFLCAICTNLAGLDALVTLECHHVFCNSCLSTWNRKSSKCPTCSTSTTSGSLQTTQPVAHRVLSRIHVQCPLRHVHCKWKGEYGDLQAHLLSSSAHTTTTTTGPVQTVQENDKDDDDDDDNDLMDADTPAALARSFKEEANAKFSSNNFAQARDLYTKGIDVMTTTTTTTTTTGTTPTAQDDTNAEDRTLLATLYANRAAALLQLENYVSCVDDCTIALEWDASYTKAYVRRCKAQIELGLFEDAVKGIEVAPNKEDRLIAEQLGQATKMRFYYQNALELLQTKNGDAATAKVLLGNLMRQTSAPPVVIAAARASLALGQTESAQRMSLQVLRRNPQLADAYVVRGHSLLLAGDFDTGLSVLREALRLDPDNEESKTIFRQCKTIHSAVKQARQSVFTRHFQEAVEAFSQALEHIQYSKTPLSAMLHAERAEAYLRLKDYTAALQDASKAIYARDDLEQAWLTKIKAYHGQGRHSDAREELEDLLQKWGANNERIQKAYEQADFLVRKQNRPDFYELLDVSSIASLMEIKKQYKVKAMEYHPDKWVNATEEEQRNAEEKFKLLGSALEILSDDFQRQLYDEGYDQDAIRERVAAAQQAAHRSQYRGGHHGHH